MPQSVADRVIEMAPPTFSEVCKRASPGQLKVLLRARFADHRRLDEFCRFCWPDQFDMPFNALHRSLFKLHDVPPWTTRVSDVRNAVAAPRGYAKSTINSFARIAHDIVYDREAFIVLMSSTQPQARRFSKRLRSAFKRKDTPFARTYGPFEVTGGVDEWEVSVRGRPSVAVLAKSFGSEVRGVIHPERGIRPTKCVVDDGEKKDRVRNPEQRQIWEDALNKDILKMGRRQGGLVVDVVGTVLHQDSMLARRLADPGWRSQRWRAIISWPDRMDLWERCRVIWADLSLGNQRRASAYAFYRSQRTTMDAGAEVLDPAAKSLFELFETIWTEGLSSFLSEFQNEPRDPSTAVFDTERFVRFREMGDGTLEVQGSKRRVRIADLRLGGWWDPAIGDIGGDFAALAVIGRDEYHYAYLLDLWMARVPPSQQLEVAWQLAARRGLKRLGVESVGFQGLVAEPYRRQRTMRREAGEYWQLVIDEVAVTENKEFRIATLEPSTTNGWLLFNETIPREALQQFDDFPTGSHDDAPDAVHGAWKYSGGAPPKMEGRPA